MPQIKLMTLNFSVMFTTENEIIRRSWRQIYRLLVISVKIDIYQNIDEYWIEPQD